MSRRSQRSGGSGSSSAGGGGGSRRSASRSPTPRASKRIKLRDSGILQYLDEKGMDEADAQDQLAKGRKLLEGSHGSRIKALNTAADGEEIMLECRVPSDSGRDTWMPYITLNKSGSRVQKHRCDCPSSKKRDRPPKDAVCKHVVAALVYYSRSGNGSPGSSPSRPATASSTPAATPSRGASAPPNFATQSGSRGSGDEGSEVWGLLQPQGAFIKPLRGMQSTHPLFPGGMIELKGSEMKIGKARSDIDLTTGLRSHELARHFATISSAHASIAPKRLEDTRKQVRARAAPSALCSR